MFHTSMAGRVALFGMVPAASAQTANRHLHGSGRFTAGIMLTDPGTGMQTRAGINCQPPKGWYNRTQACVMDGASINWYDSSGQLVGSTSFVMTQAMQLNPGGLGFSEVLRVVTVVNTGTYPTLGMNLFVTCGNTCKVTYHWPQGATLADGTHGSLDYTDTAPTGAVNTFKTAYQLTLVSPEITNPVVFKWKLPVSIRCDNNMPGITGPGCVFPAFTPTFTVSRTQYGASAAMIAWAQANLSAHWGLRGKGKPLTRLTGAAAIDDNRKIICERNWTPFPPWTSGSVTDKDSCDEFPFASTYQSGAMHGVTTGKECAQVEAVKTSSTGTIAHIWNNVKPIGSYSAGAKCVRGHIPYTLNTTLGRIAWLDFIRANRILNENPFWMKVTS
jgi:hypothetical protein